MELLNLDGESESLVTPCDRPCGDLEKKSQTLSAGSAGSLK